MKTPVLLALDRCVLEFRGADRVRFLNGQLSNDVRKLAPERALHACVMTAKGRMNGEVWLTELGDAIRLDGSPGLGEELLARFERYVISDDVIVEDLSETWALFHILGETNGVSAQRFGLPGIDRWQPKTSAAPTDFPALSPAEIESLRIAQGIPAWGSELNEHTIPVEAGLDLDCIDYHKGCYIGQEVISRIKSVGHVNRLLVRLLFPKDTVISIDAPLFAGETGVGQITSHSPGLESENIVALAYVKRNFSTPGTILQLNSPTGIPVHVLALHP